MKKRVIRINPLEELTYNHCTWQAEAAWPNPYSNPQAVWQHCARISQSFCAAAVLTVVHSRPRTIEARAPLDRSGHATPCRTNRGSCLPNWGQRSRHGQALARLGEDSSKSWIHGIHRRRAIGLCWRQNRFHLEDLFFTRENVNEMKRLLYF